MNYNIAQPFFESAQKYPEKLALFADGKRYNYRDLLHRVTCVANWLATGCDAPPQRVGILGSRSAEVCVGILAAAWVGAAYVPISLKQPELGVADLLKRSGLGALIADRAGSRMLTPRVLQEAPAKILAVRDGIPASSDNVAFMEDLPAASLHEPLALAADELAYILYTSGSTGVPKGVMLSAGGVHHLLNCMQAGYPLSHDDRLAETTDITFDLTVYNMFATWRAGASLHVVPPAQAMAPAKLVQDHQITAWLSVPAIGAFMSRMGLLKANAFPSLKYTFFAGEPLLARLAEEWSVAAPHSIVANMYGPTEATVICIGQEYGPSCTLTRDSVAIGKPFPGMQAAVAISDTEFAPALTQGELLLAGPQLAVGYLDDAEKTAARFVHIAGTRWYKTGDLVYCDENGMFHFLGRIDHQVKILGYRVELEEIECHLRDVTGCADVAAIAWPLQNGSATGVVGFLGNYAGLEEQVKGALQQRLPSYMVPSRVHALAALPLNNNGKVDRNALVRMLEQKVL